jgi:hypothetical protein
MGGDGGFCAPARTQLIDYAIQMNRMWGKTGILNDGHASIETDAVDGLGDAHPSFAELIASALGTAFPDGSR